MRKYNTIISIILIIVGAAGICLALNFDARGGNVGDPGAAFWPIMLCCGLIFTSALLLIQTMIESKKAAEKEEPLIDYRSAGVRCVFIIFGIMIGYAILLYFFGFIYILFAVVMGVVLPKGVIFY